MKTSLYKHVVELYQNNGSVNETAKTVGIASATVRKILITEGLWSSELGNKISELWQQGLCQEEIADRLVITVKCVQAYLPYSRIVM